MDGQYYIWRVQDFSRGGRKKDEDTIQTQWQGKNGTSLGERVEKMRPLVRVGTPVHPYQGKVTFFPRAK